ncbi:DASH complex subunit Duo1 [Macrophomina phaseolina MS6]|uniref:DASH complex subunit DUO1 n=1 Tax=Macrophomina phaseolina (strain MS6) TaxID=1126212 RepID=K2RZQ5_MACPH|nr:DASH complex subunit Duo1 [Macrophomina phaseolina MS6]
MDDHYMSDPDIDLDSPIQPQPTPAAAAASPSRSPGRPKPPRAESRYTTEDARDEALRRELEQVRGVNKVIEDVIESLEKAKNNMHTVNRTVNSASTLLHTWTRILSTTEHNQRLILDPNWQGATQDLAEIEADTIAQQRAVERREREEQARREAALRKAEEDEPVVLVRTGAFPDSRYVIYETGQRACRRQDQN